MKFNEELFAQPNEAQRQLMDVIDTMIEFGESREYIHQQIDRQYDDPAIAYFLRAYLSWRLPYVTAKEGYALYVGVDRDSREGTVLEQVRAFTYAKGLYVHVDLEYPEPVDEDIDLKIEVSLSGSEVKRSTGWDCDLIDIFHDGDRLHMYPFSLADMVGEEGIPVDEERTLSINVLKNDELFLSRSVLVRGSEQAVAAEGAAADAAAAKRGPSVEERLATLDKHPGLDAFRERALDLAARFRVAEARKKAGLAPNAPVQVLGTLDGMLKTTVVISAPVIIIMFLATIGLGLVNRTAPQLNVFFLSMPVKSALGVAMLIVYLPFIMDMLMYTKETEILLPVQKLLGG